MRGIGNLLLTSFHHSMSFLLWWSSYNKAFLLLPPVNVSLWFVVTLFFFTSHYMSSCTCCPYLVLGFSNGCLILALFFMLSKETYSAIHPTIALISSFLCSLSAFNFFLISWFQILCFLVCFVMLCRNYLYCLKAFVSVIGYFKPFIHFTERKTKSQLEISHRTVFWEVFFYF